MEAAASPLPRLETTPPVTKIYFVISCSPQSTFLLVRSPAACPLQSIGARPELLGCQILSQVCEAVRALREFQAARALFEQTSQGTLRDTRRVPSACGNSITELGWHLAIPRTRNLRPA